MKLSKSDLEQIVRHGSSAPGSNTAPDACPTAEQIALVATGEFGISDEDAEPAAIVHHIAGCSECSDQLRLALSMHQALVGEPPQPVVVVARRLQVRRGGWSLLAAAALLLGAVMLSSLWRTTSRAPTDLDLVRGGDRLAGVATPADRASLDGAPASLDLLLASLPSTPDTRFTALLFDAEAERLWESAPSVTPSFVLPAAVRDRLERGKTYGWRVVARDRISSWQSSLYRFEIRK